MRDVELLEEGLALMGLGMGFVFVFLTILVITITLLSLLLRRFAPDPAEPVTSGAARSAPPAQQDDEVMAVIGVALHRYRQHHHR
ncbi:MAG: OadG family protein [Halomonas sp.]|uniref:OadG family protein n=1 Tax=Halomonas sp. TaxID=1486246 RepID=UPI003970BC3A